MRSDQMMIAEDLRRVLNFGLFFWTEGAFFQCYILQAELSLGSPERVGN